MSGIKGRVGKHQLTWVTAPRGRAGTAQVDIESTGKSEVSWRLDAQGIWIELASGCYGFDLRKEIDDEGRVSFEVVQRVGEGHWSGVSFVRAGEESLGAAAGGAKKGVKIKAQMPGKIIRVLAKTGDSVKKDQSLVVMEAMKMENEIRALLDGKVKDVLVKEGQAVETGALLVVLE